MKTMRIKEMAERFDLSPRAIRFYEEKGLLHPQRDAENGYRYYTEKDAQRLQAIIAFREVGVPLEQIKTILEQVDEQGIDDVMHALELQRSTMFAEWLDMRRSIEATDQMIETIKKKRQLLWDDLFHLTGMLKKMREQRLSWKDRWNFDLKAEYHDELVYDSESGSPRHPHYQQALTLVFRQIQPCAGEFGLDLGTGTGNLASLFLQQGIRMAGVDQSRAMLSKCRQKHPALETRLGNMLAIPYLDQTFDFVVSSYALHTLQDEQKLLSLAEMKRVLKSGGRICIVDVMFQSRRHCEAFMQRLHAEGQTELLAYMEESYVTELPLLVSWLKEHRYDVNTLKLDEMLYLIHATPKRGESDSNSQESETQYQIKSYSNYTNALPARAMIKKESSR